MRYQCRLVNCNKCTTVVQEIDSGGGCACVGTGICGNSLYFPFNSSVNVKVLLKITFIN